MDNYDTKHQGESILPALGSHQVARSNSHRALSEHDELPEDQHLKKELPSSLSISDFVNQLLRCNKKPIDHMVETMMYCEGLTVKIVRFIMFRKYEMNVKKETVHRCLAHN